jgi:GH43 family beta-xylosidase
MQPVYDFPLTKGHGDPVVFPWQGLYYYIATNDNTDDRGFFVRRAKSCAGLFSGDYEERVILDVSDRFVQTFWAPEFHVIGEDLYLLFAVSGKVWGPQCYMMKLKRGGEIINAGDWDEPVRVCRKDGSPLADNAITLDMTCLNIKDQYYVVWSYRVSIGTALDSGSMLYIAMIDPACPYRLSSEPVLLSRPLFGWENMDGTINNEGPYALIAGHKVFLTYSGGAADGYSYVLGLLTADLDDDLLDPTHWSKWPTAVLSYMSIPGEYGPGHNSFFRDEDGNIMIAYHAKMDEKRSSRCASIHRIHFGLDGRPVFDLSSQRDLDPRLRHVQTVVHVP